MHKKAVEIAELLKTLANENRLLILCELIHGPKSVGELCGKLDHISQSALSQHLALLKAHGILSSIKSGQSVTYHLCDSRVENLIQVLRAHYCTDGEDILS